MAFTDMPLEDLRSFRPQVTEPDDFDAFWSATLEEARKAGGEATVEPWDGPAVAIEILDVSFPGFAGEPIKAWLTRPHGQEGPLPCIVEYAGYGGGRAMPFDELKWANAGYVHLRMDTRGQGGTWGGSDTPDPHGSHAQNNGMMTKGVLDPSTYYYRRLFTDAVRAVDFVEGLPYVDSSRIVVAGVSQGGGTALAAGALADGVAAVLSDVPYLCNFERAVTLATEGPYLELTQFLSVQRHHAAAIQHTLSYVDGVNFAKRITAPTMVSVGLMDPVCPPSTIFAAVNAMPTPPELEVYPFNGHEGGGAPQVARQQAWLAQLLQN